MEFPFQNLWIFCLCILLHVILPSSSSSSLQLESTTPSFRNESDRLSLLAFKQGIKEDPLQILSSWNDSLHFCQWHGVTCSRRHHQRVTILNLTGYDLVGPISPHIGNLSFLRKIFLSHNNFYGEINQAIGRLFRLQYLIFTGNSLQGEIPANLSHCTKLKVIDLSYNQLTGKLPIELASLPKLYLVYFVSNNLTGTIPSSFGNVSSLAGLSLANNNFKGSIPTELAGLSNLIFLVLGGNQLSGMIPSAIYNLSSIEILYIENNQLYGHISPKMFLAFPQLQELLLDLNQFTGPLPVSLSNASKLEKVDFGGNNFTGPMPENMGSMQELYSFNMGSNQIGSREGNDLHFLSSMANCSHLQRLNVLDNRLTGVLPNAIANFSMELTQLILGSNNIYGSIPRGIENLVSLILLALEYNFLIGTLPDGIGNLKKLQYLDLESNKISGEIPSSIGNITKLSSLYLGKNNFHGSIPLNFRNWGFMDDLDLSQNNLNDTVLKVAAIHLNLSQNSFYGSLMMEVSNLKQVSVLDVSKNKLSGEIPDMLGNCVSLAILYLQDNWFHGTIPPSLSTLKGIQRIDLAFNNLSGQIPKYFENFLYLEYLNLSFNNLEGEVPKGGIFKNASAFSILGNKKLCGGIPELHLLPCPKQASKKRGNSSSHKSTIILASVISSSFLISCILFALFWIRYSKRKPSFPPSIENQWLQVSYGDLIKATNGFSSVNLIGVGSFGSVYKAALDCIETVVAVKVLNLLQQGSIKSFLAECEALRNTRHRNLVKIITACSSIDFKGNDFKALIFEYMPNGSLEEWLHQNVHEQHPPKNLNLIQRLNIAIDIASALDYLHHHSQTPIVHRDLKPSNVLLDDDMVAHVGDFGLAKFLIEAANNSSTKNQASTSEIKGSIGYTAPEYGMGSKASTNGDVYSYGVILLEIITGKRPTDNMFKDDLSLHQFAKLALSEQVIEIVDPRLLLEETEIIEGSENCSNLKNRVHDCLVSLVRMGVSCTTKSPGERLDIRDVVVEMHAIKNSYLGV